jgi:predicted site-specific integrase-resolvase
MKAAEVLNLLRISRPTLTNYVKQGYLKVATLPNGRYDYNDKSVYRFMNKDIPRKNVIYARVSTRKQKKDLENQIQLLKHLCFQNGIIP